MSLEDKIVRMDKVDVDLDRGGMVRSRLGHVTGELDALENIFGVRVFRDGKPESVENATVTGYFLDSAGNERTLEGDAEGNEAWVALTGACYDRPGTFRLAVKLTQGGVTSTLRIVDGMIADTYFAM